jgi:hypothetical protein
MRCLLALIPSLCACGDAGADSTKAFPAETHTYVVDAVHKSSLTMHVDGCPTSTATATWLRSGGDPHAPPTDAACLAKITAGKTIVHSVQMFENPKLQPRRMIVRRLDGCSATDVVITPAFAPCRTPVDAGVAKPSDAAKAAEVPSGTTFERFGFLGVSVPQAAIEAKLGEGHTTSGHELRAGRVVWGLNYRSRGIEIGVVGPEMLESGIVTDFILEEPNRFKNAAGISIGTSRAALIKALGSRYKQDRNDRYEITVKVPAPTQRIVFELNYDKVVRITVGLEPKE